MCVYIYVPNVKFPSTILTSFRQERIILPPPPSTSPPTKKQTPKNPKKITVDYLSKSLYKQSKCILVFQYYNYFFFGRFFWFFVLTGCFGLNFVFFLFMLNLIFISFGFLFFRLVEIFFGRVN